LKGKITMSKKTHQPETGASHSSALFTPREHAILAQYLGLRHLRPKEAEDPTLLDPIDPETWDESTQGIGVPPPSDLQGDLATNLQAAVANICLATASDLPQWAVSPKEGEIIFGRPLKKPGDRPARILLPQAVGRINWGTSGPGISWPEKYYLTRIPHYECWILTASQETSEVTGYLDWAVHHTPGDLQPKEAADQSLLVYWSDCAQLNQPPFESIEEAGLLSSRELTAIAELVWPGCRIAAESYDEFVARTGFDLGKHAAQRRLEEEEGGF
jgi:hypothetical protein